MTPCHEINLKFQLVFFADLAHVPMVATDWVWSVSFVGYSTDTIYETFVCTHDSWEGVNRDGLSGSVGLNLV